MLNNLTIYIRGHSQISHALPVNEGFVKGVRLPGRVKRLSFSRLRYLYTSLYDLNYFSFYVDDICSLRSDIIESSQMVFIFLVLELSEVRKMVLHSLLAYSI